MANEPRKPTAQWVTGKNVRTHEPDKGLKDVNPGIKAEVAAGIEEPAASANKPEWYAYRRGQGYTEATLEPMTKDELKELPDDPDEFVAPDEDSDNDDAPQE